MAKKKNLKPPRIASYARRYWDAWRHLKGDRQFAGMAGAPTEILFNAIESYARRFEFNTRDEFEDLLEIIKALDVEYTEWCNKRTKKKDVEVKE